MHVTFINHAGFRYLRWSLVLVAAAIAAYAWHEPRPAANGGTWLGFTLGGLSALIVLMLLWLGVRKRRYRSRMGTMRGWLSAHFYLGLSLPVLAALHSGFQFHWNIHTLAYALMILVILSGIWGSVMYLRNPGLMAGLGPGQSREMLAGRKAELDEESLKLADRIDAEIHGKVAAALRPVERPGVWARIRGRRGAGDVEADRHFSPAGDTWQLESEVAGALARSREAERVQALRDLLDVIGRRRALSLQLGNEMKLQSQIEIWLLLHIPLSLALLAALLSHVLAVFFYR